MRFVGWQVTPLLMADDGDDLRPVQTNSTQILAADWAAFKNGGDEEALAGLRAQIETAPPDTGGAV